MKLLRVISTSEIVRMVSKNRGWVEVHPAEGPNKKYRQSALYTLTDAEIIAINTVVNPPPPPAGKLVDPDFDKYVKHSMKTPSGRRALDIDDEAAATLRGVALVDCYYLVAKRGASTEVVAFGDERTEEERIERIETALRTKYEHLNPGMQRMNLGNVLRRAMGTYGNLNAHKTKKPTKGD